MPHETHWRARTHCIAARPREGASAPSQAASEVAARRLLGFLVVDVGKGSERLAGVHAASSERVVSQHLRAGTVLLDLRRAFKRIRHGVLLDAARKSGFPLRQLRLLIAAHRSPRALEYAGVSSVPTETQQAVLAGCQFATLCLQMVLLCPLDVAQAAFVPARARRYRLELWQTISAFTKLAHASQ